ncbi:hypothetical protein [Cardinium endosymbiont of Tipula unca]|uniref:hypothetical protein n=1 Tax=Cardinium endosymbiont of Tipula unca TaxID=3066216 RepID=UPI0030D36371
MSILDFKMSLKKYLLRSYFATISLIVFCGNCHNTHLAQEEEDFYTNNTYTLPEYSPEEFKQLLSIKSPNDITNFRKKLEKKIPKWLASGTEVKPSELWSHFRAEVLKTLEEEGLPTLKNYHDSFGKLLEEPTEANEKKMIAANEELQANPKAAQALRTFFQHIYNKNLTESLLAYHEFAQFVHSKKTNNLHLSIKRLHSSLASWKKDGYLSGLQLWHKIMQKEKNKLTKESKVFRYTENQKATEESLKLTDQLANSPYCVNYKELQETLPHGLEKLNTILDDVYYLKEQGDVALLKRYCAIISKGLKS